MTTAVSARDVLRMRLAAQLVAASGPALDPSAVVRHLLGIQAQDFGQALWAIGLRSGGSTRAAVLDALADGSIVRSSPFRGTLMFAPAEDLGWMLRISAARTLKGSATRQRQLGLDGDAIPRARALTEDVLGGGRTLGREAYFEVLEAAGISTKAGRGYHIIWSLAQTGVVCWGPAVGSQQKLVLNDEWIKTPRQLDADEGLRELAVRYFTGHGPATLKDLAWWAKTTVVDAKRGIELGRPELEQLELDGDTYWAASGRAEIARDGVHALPSFDEFLLGYADRSLALAPEHFDRVVPSSNGIFLPLIVARGEVIGTWNRASAEPDPFTTMTSTDAAAFARAAASYLRFIA